jgi:hypothetical protein
MYNRIEVLFTTSKSHEESTNAKEDSLYLLPWPNSYHLSEKWVHLTKSCIVSVRNINPSHALLQMMAGEFQEAFDIAIEWVSTSPAFPVVPVPLLNPTQEVEGYILQIRPGYVLLHSATLHGLFNAFQTLSQILQQSDTSADFSLQCCEIIDWPCLQIRGVADDVSRGQIPTVESAKRFIKEISRFKNNYYALYIEDVFRSSRHPAIGKGRGAFTPEELIEIDRYARSRFVTVFPIFETLGHADNILTLPEYRELGEFPGAQCFSPANGNIYPLLRDFIEELSPCFTSKIFHIGLDETWDLGWGNSADLIKAIGIDQVFLDLIRKMYNMAKENGNKQIILYHDVIAKYPQIWPDLPKDLVFMIWDYTPKKKYPIIKRIMQAGFPVIVSPSMLCWSRHFPDYRSAGKNIINIIESAKELRNHFPIQSKLDGEPQKNSSSLVLGQLTSTWGDFSHHNLRENNLYGAIIGGVASWNETKPIYEEIVRAIGRLVFGLKTPQNLTSFENFFTELADMNKLYKTGPPLVFKRFYDYLYRHPFYDATSKPTVKKYSQIKQQSEALLATLENLSPHISNHLFLVPYLHYAVSIAQLLGEKDLMRVTINSLLKTTSNLPTQECVLHLKSFRDRAFILRNQYEKLWLQCAKSPGLDRPLNRFDALIQACDEKILQIDQNVFFQDPLLPSAYIWAKNRHYSPLTRYFRKSFRVSGQILDAKIQVIAGNVATLFVNGQYLGHISSRNSLSYLPLTHSVEIFDVTSVITEGLNVIGVEANNYLHSRGSLNVYLLYQVQKDDGTVITVPIMSDGSWGYHLGPFENGDWCHPSIFEEKELQKEWKKVSIRGYPPKINGWLFTPDLLLKGKKSLTEDLFGLRSSLVHMLSLLFGKRIARVARWLFRL